MDWSGNNHGYYLEVLLCILIMMIIVFLHQQIFLGRKDGFDRGRIKKTIERHRNDIQKALMELKGYGMTWEISGNIFNIDDNSSDFCDWLLKFDKEGDESFLSMTYGKTDERISEENICAEIISKVKLILPLYNIFTWRK